MRLYDACLHNSKALIEEAELLFKHDHFARAFSLGITAYEELGKSQIVADYFNDMTSLIEFNDAFKKHDIKSAYNARKFDLNISTITYDVKKSKGLLKCRNDSLYVNYNDDFEPQEPINIINSEDAAKVIKAARKELEDIIKMAAITERIGSKSFMK